MNLERLNAIFAEITAIFDAAGVTDFTKLPDDPTERAAFAKQFNQFNAVLEAAKIQGFAWEKLTAEGIEPNTQIQLDITHHQYLTLLQRYKELGSSGGGGGEAIPYDIDSHITERDTGKIDADYMNSRFAKYLKELQSGDEHAKETTLVELQRSFSSLSQEEQKHAGIFLHDIQRGDVKIEPGRTFRDYLCDYQAKAKNKEVEALVELLGVDAEKLRALMNSSVTEANLNDYGRFDALRETMDNAKARVYFETLEGQTLPAFRVKIKASNLLQRFILEGGFEIEAAGDAEEKPEEYSIKHTGYVFIGTKDYAEAEVVFEAYLSFAVSAGFRPINHGEFIEGSWIRKGIEFVQRVVSSKEAKEAFTKAQKALELAKIEKLQSEVNSNNATAAAALLKSVEPVPEFAARIGSLLVLKTVKEGKQKASVIVLTTQQLAMVENQPELMNSPSTLLVSLNSTLLQ
jgi:hypothetical protein